MALADEPESPRYARNLHESPVRWGGIWAGLLMTMGILVILTSLGVAIGITTANNTPPGNTVLTTAAAIWGAASFLVALFIGGAVSARFVTGATTSMIQGASVWALSMLAVFYLAGFGVSLGARGIFAAIENPALVQTAMADLQNSMGQVGTTGTVNNVQPSLEMASWITFGVIVVSLLFAVLGAIIARRRRIVTVA